MTASQQVKQLIEQGDRLFDRRRACGLLSLWQTQAENFNPLRADFTTTRHLGEEFASHLMTGQPVLAHRDLSNALSAMLRPRGKPWFMARTDDERLNDNPTNRKWLDAKSDTMRRIMYDQHSQFVRATKQGDGDFTSFGQAVISVDPNRARTGLLYRSRHLRDVVWCENAELQIDTVHANENSLEARQLVKLFPKSCHKSVIRAAEKEPYKPIKCRHIVLPYDQYELAEKRKGSRQFPFVSIWVDLENQHVMEELPRRRFGYVIPRWVLVSGSQYAHSPATVVALPDARMLQMINLTLLEAGQKAVDPPLKVTGEAVQGGVNWYAGGITTVDSEYDERLGKAIEPLFEPSPGLGWGDKREEKIEKLIREAFFLDVIGLPPIDGGEKMTAAETNIRFEEYIRRSLPLFEPMEVDYNGGLCEETFNLSMDLGAFGTMEDMPRELRGMEIRWQFESPLQAANDRAKASAFRQAGDLLAVAAGMSQTPQYELNVPKALRDALGSVSRSDWLYDQEQSEKLRAEGEEREAALAQMQALSAGANVAGQVAGAAESAGNAAQSLQGAGLA